MDRHINSMASMLNKYTDFLLSMDNIASKFFEINSIHTLGIVVSQNETTHLIRSMAQKMGIQILFELKSGWDKEVKKPDAIFNASVLIENRKFQKYFDAPIFNIDDVFKCSRIL